MRLFRSHYGGRVCTYRERAFSFSFRVHLTWPRGQCASSILLSLFHFQAIHSLSLRLSFSLHDGFSLYVYHQRRYVRLSLSFSFSLSLLGSPKRAREEHGATSCPGASRRVADSSGSRSTFYIRQSRSRGPSPSPDRAPRPHGDTAAAVHVCAPIRSGGSTRIAVAVSSCTQATRGQTGEPPGRG